MEDEVKDIIFLPQSFGVHVKQTDKCSVCGRKRRSSEVFYVRQQESIAVVSLQTFYLGKHDLLTVYLGKLDFLSVTDFSLVSLPLGNFIVWVLDMSRKQ